MRRDHPTLRRASLAVLVAMLGALSGCGGTDVPTDDPTSDASATPSAQTTAAEDVARAECPPAASRGDRRAAVDVARCAVIATTEFSYRDRDHRAWIDRVAPYATETFVADLRELFGPDVPAEARLWKDLAEAETEARTLVTRAEAARDGATFLVTVVAEVERRTADAPDWEPYGEPRTYEVTLERAGRDWRVTNIVW